MTAPSDGAAEAKRVETGAEPEGEFSYSVLPTDRRGGGPRQRVRLRSGKLIRRDGLFLCECLVNNRSPSGCRLKLPAALDLPPTLYFYDDQSEALFQGRIIWRKDREAGLRLVPCITTALHRSIAGAMRRKFYALKR